MNDQLDTVARWSSSPTISTVDGSRSISSLASRRAPSTADSPGSTRPPGKLTSPWWVLGPQVRPRGWTTGAGIVRAGDPLRPAAAVREGHRGRWRLLAGTGPARQPPFRRLTGRDVDSLRPLVGRRLLGAGRALRHQTGRPSWPSAPPAPRAGRAVPRS